MTKAAAPTSTRERSSVRCSTRVIASGSARASLRRLSEIAIGIEIGRPLLAMRPGQFTLGSSDTTPLWEWMPCTPCDRDQPPVVVGSTNPTNEAFIRPTGVQTAALIEEGQRRTDRRVPPRVGVTPNPVNRTTQVLKAAYSWDYHTGVGGHPGRRVREFDHDWLSHFGDVRVQGRLVLPFCPRGIDVEIATIGVLVIAGALCRRGIITFGAHPKGQDRHNGPQLRVNPPRRRPLRCRRARKSPPSVMFWAATFPAS